MLYTGTKFVSYSENMELMMMDDDSEEGELSDFETVNEPRVHSERVSLKEIYNIS